jgi:polyvinyl alcohol dehydrogenase (cytochrome)
LAVRLSRRALLATTTIAATAPLGVVAQEATPAAEPTNEGAWPRYGYDLAGTRSIAETQISAETVDLLGLRWQLDLGGPISGTPIVAEGMVYIGSYTGQFVAVDLEIGRIVWAYNTGAAVPDPNLHIDLGILGSAAIDGDTVYVGDATATVHALDKTSGTLRWKVKIDEQMAACIWSSPIVVEGTVYVGVAAIAEEPGFRGNVVALDAATGEERWRTFSVAEKADGGGIFAVPAIDAERQTLYVGTQNAYSPSPEPYGNPISLLALDLATGKERWVFNAPPGGGPEAPTEDVGFGASPNLFTGRIFGQERDLIGIGQKSGTYWVLDRETGEFIWRTEVSPAGFFGGIQGTSAVAGNRILVPASNWPEFDGPASGLVSALDVGTGRVLWSATQTAPTASPVAISDDLAFSAGLDGILHAYALQSGQEVWQADLGASVSSGIAITNDTVVVAAATPAAGDGTAL